jgi:predicted dehydrogenase
MTEDGHLGVAVIGLGVGEAHARAFASLPACRVVSVSDLNRAHAERLAADFSAEVIETEDVFRDQRTDIVSIASYDDDHFGQVIAALAARKHAFVEKPLCRSDAELGAVKEAWSVRGDRHVASNLVLRAAPLYLWLRHTIRSGALGDVYAFDGDYLYGRMHKITDEWRSEVDDYSVMQGGGVHLVDLLLWLTGERPVRVTAAGNRISTRDTAFRYADFVSATYEFQSGLVARITANFGCVHRHQHVLRVFGTRATFVSDDLGARLHASRGADTGAIAVELAPKPPSKGALIPEFVDAILAGSGAGPALQRELDVIAACVAADRALASREPTEIAYV